MENTLSPISTSVGIQPYDEKSVSSELAHGVNISIVNLLAALLKEAHHARASDVHFNPNEKGIRIRMRIDGVLLEKYTFEKKIHSEVIARIKVLSALRTDEHQAAQDGRFRIMIDNQPVDVRVSITPTYYGENAVMRLLGNKSHDHTLASLGFSEKDQKH